MTPAPLPSFVAQKHIAFIEALDTKKEELEYWLSEHLRISGIYWGLTCLDLLGRRDALDRDGVIRFVLDCQHECGGFGGHPGHDPHLLYTLSAVQILAIYDELERIDVDRVVQYVVARAQPDGSFTGDRWGEIDTRFSFCALATLWILGRLHNNSDSAMQALVDRAVSFIDRCQNFDGGFGSVPGAESHAGQIFCCVGALAMVDRLDVVDADLLGWWLCERQKPCGGLNGRPEKLEDVCYSWWVLSSLRILGRMRWIDASALRKFILECQDTESGGIADRPGDMADVFHTLFGVAGLSLLAEAEAEDSTTSSPDSAIGFALKPVDPVFCLPRDTVERLRKRHLYP